MLQKLKTKSQGFTIIEVMIVLAVAALIILIVLLAVPALQRSSRNTTIKSDASTVAAGISSWEQNNGGALPGYVQGTGTVSIGSASGAADVETVSVQGSTKVEPLVASTGNQPVAAKGTDTAGKVSPGQIEVWSGHKCNTDPNNRSVSVWYVTETGSNPKIQCIET